ncbi:hypothetical protein B0H10DRAFT_2220017 [Mycena sp. CBHHK59/15]|nr:hypothetical protein B0H10DRAFT_2220017 [Mycena sp. CBHHK59/15]
MDSKSQAAAPVTVETIKGLIASYFAYGQAPARLPLQLLKGIALAAVALGGSWGLDADHPIASCFEGITLICWRFSGAHPADAAAQYKDLVLKNYNLWASYMTGSAKSTFAHQCHSRTDSLPDWTYIAKELVYRQDIIYQAISVTTGMFDQGSREVTESEALWNTR